MNIINIIFTGLFVIKVAFLLARDLLPTPKQKPVTFTTLKSTSVQIANNHPRMVDFKLTWFIYLKNGVGGWWWYDECHQDKS